MIGGQRGVAGLAGATCAFALFACGSSEEPSATPSPGIDAGEDVAAEAAPEAAAEGGDSEDATDAVSDAPPDAGIERRTYNGSAGLRDYLLYRPGDGTQELPVVVVLHGCGQSASEFADLTGFNELAANESFVTIWPEQSASVNPYLCWNWFLPSHQQRDTGDAAVIAAIVDEVAGEGGVDASKVYAVGLSAGGAMSVVMGTVFPDKFAAVASVEGCPFKHEQCLTQPSSKTGDELAVLAHEAMGANARTLPVFVVQGDADSTVAPVNGDLLVEQFLGVADLVDNAALDGSVAREPASETSETAEGGKSYDILVYTDGQGDELVRRWTVHGLGHAWPGGTAGMPFSDPAGPNAAEAAWEFFSLHALP